MPDVKRIREIVKGIESHLKARYGNGIKQVILYGSYARGEATDDSDVDVAIVVADELDPKEVEEYLNDFLFEVLLEERELVSVVAIREDHFRSFNSAFILNVKAEGVVV